MPSFDVVSKADWSEIKNAINQAQREVSQRFDFKGTNASIEAVEAGVVISASADDRAKAALDVLKEKLIRRKVSLKHLVVHDPEPGPKGSSRIRVDVKEGIETEKAKDIIKILKDSKIKVQASIHEDSVRVSGKKRDDLQECIQLLKSHADDLALELQFVNFRD